MALAPRPNLAPAKGGAKKSKSSVSTAAGKARQRARNKGATGNAGSSGKAKAVSKMPKRLWEEIEDEVEHLCDVAGKISHSQVGASGWLVSTLNSPLEYAHDLLDAHMKARDGLVYIRVYYVDIEKYLGEGYVADDDETGG